MAQVDKQGSHTQSMMMHKAKQKQEIVGKIEEIDLGATDVILFSSSQALNASDSKKFPLIMRPNPEDHYLTSDPEVDEQLMIKLSFRDPVALTHIVIRADKGPTYDKNKNDNKKDDDNDTDDDDDNNASGPKLIKLYANKPEIDFTDAEDTPPSQQLVITKEQLKGEKNTIKIIKISKM